MAKPGEQTSIKAIFQGMADGASGGFTILQGTVTKTSPLQIQITNDEKLILNQNNTYIPRHLTDYKTEVTVEWHTEVAAAHTHPIWGRKPILIHNALKKGDVVHILPLNHGKQYYVLDRIE